MPGKTPGNGGQRGLLPDEVAVQERPVLALDPPPVAAVPHPSCRLP